ncbi:hypothetical protein QVD17_17578 [Tagetes erecta]|uniref:Uncharacterized protein n=1 Tax=Tagetes erecta TaxID=13708 RepID=A0AAD8KWB3_TARER|nr:hypothetical protein QVD17_17578 [Tagetes erecta]
MVVTCDGGGWWKFAGELQGWGTGTGTATALGFASSKKMTTGWVFIMDFAEQVLDSYPHLQFDQNTREFTRYTSLVRMEPEPNVMVGRKFLETVQEKERYNGIVGVNTPWSRLFEMNFPAYRELTLEFYSDVVKFHWLLRNIPLHPRHFPQIITFLFIISHHKTRITQHSFSPSSSSLHTHK